MALLQQLRHLTDISGRWRGNLRKNLFERASSVDESLSSAGNNREVSASFKHAPEIGTTSAAPQPKRIALFLPQLAGGGAERSILNLAEAILDRGIAVDLVVAHPGGELVSRVPAGVRLVSLNASSTAAGIPKLTRYLKTERPDTIMSALDHANIAAQIAVRLSGSRARSVISIRNTFSAESALRKSLKRRIEAVLAKRLYPGADAILSVSDGAAEDVARFLGIPRERITVTHNPVVSDHLFRQAAEPVDHPWFVPGAPPVILAAGRLSDQKDYPTLIRAFAAARRNSGARLVILGDGERRADLEALIHSLGLHGDVLLPGFVHNPYAYMAKAFVFVLSSRHEGLPGVLIQALACGCPVIATDCPSGPREILEGGRFGALVPVGDEAALSSALRASLLAPRQTPSPESWAPFTFERSTQRYLDMLIPAGKAP
jgi:glycosyltransferase involved in cell wall biosynthesis